MPQWLSSGVLAVFGRCDGMSEDPSALTSRRQVCTTVRVWARFVGVLGVTAVGLDESATFLQAGDLLGPVLELGEKLGVVLPLPGHKLLLSRRNFGR
jgi:hypothetical protein